MLPLRRTCILDEEMNWLPFFETTYNTASSFYICVKEFLYDIGLV
jgi:hypothetical protein